MRRIVKTCNGDYNERVTLLGTAERQGRRLFYADCASWANGARRRRRFRGHRFTYPVPHRLRKSAAVSVYAQLAPVGARSERPGASPETGAGGLA